MTKKEFIQRFADELGLNAENLEESTPLDSLSVWDSMGQIATVGMIDEALQFEPPQGALGNCSTLGDIVALVSDQLEG